MRGVCKKYLLAGMLVVVPMSLTYVVLAFLVNVADDAVTPWVTALARRLGANSPEDFHVPGLGIFCLLAFVFGVGLLASNFMGEKAVEIGDRFLQRIPLVRGIYHGAKTMLTTIAGASPGQFRNVYLAGFPSTETPAYGMATGPCRGEIGITLSGKTGKEFVNVFVPSTPNFTNGYLLFVPKEESIRLNLTLEDGFHSLLSLGILDPSVGERAKLSEKKP
jgi:uncharacterized membrane protein